MRLPVAEKSLFAAAVRLHQWMDEPSSTSMIEQDRKISEIIEEERSRLRNFIRRRVPTLRMSMTRSGGRGGTETALASERHRRRLFNPGGCRNADLPDEQPWPGE